MSASPPDLDRLDATLAERGWLAIDLPEPRGVFAARERLLGYLRSRILSLDRLEDYHLHAGDDDMHIATLYELATFWWDTHLGRTIVTDNLEIFRRLIGPDLHIQPYPYLRAVRPGHAEDAAPLHRDTYYGASPFEVSVLIPFTAMDRDAAVRVIGGSHLESDASYPFVQTTSSRVEVRSPRHQLGYPYAPRLLDPALMGRAEPVPLEVGQALLFPLQLVHGGGGASARTRFSTDIRLAHSLAPVRWSRGVRDDYFVPLCASAITRAARTYLAANEASAPPEIAT